MNDKLLWDILTAGIALAVVLTIQILSCRQKRLSRHITDLRIRELIHSREEATRYQMMLKQVKYHDKTNSALHDLRHIFNDKISILHERYPQLTDLDVQVLLLIGIGIENHDILQYTDMSKRTYYKRRQLIAQRMGTTAAQLNELAQHIFTPKF